jgi:hypothetical protein
MAVDTVPSFLIKAKEELMDVQNINAVGTEYGGMLRSAGRR